ncbi:tetratricopeptide repeat protein 14-like isoform X2 [Penaeus japonicus]|uniref:tetratricopeptide repeat protein 14-like isoform X2 n=1 Tax=Penaeus japonicus TaxID=27405 RepID=UPI001C70E74B|nr:tetratricopeptide repeat protein 14-like isoform X2 [Penaeus japonicus]
MAAAVSLNSDLVTRSVNFHGHALLKQLTTDHPKDITQLNLKEVNYAAYKAHLLEFCNERKMHTKELHDFISKKAEHLFVSSELYPWVEEDMDEYGVKDRYDHLPPLEYFWKLSKKAREELFYKNVKRGDLLFVQVTGHVNELVSAVRVQATMGFVTRDLHNTHIKAHLRVEDTDPEPADCDTLGRYLTRTRLLVEVLEVDPADEYIRVGAKGVAIPAHLKDKVVLGKAKVSDRPPVVDVMEGRTRQCYDECLRKLKSFTNPRSVRHLAGKLGVDIFSQSSLMYTLRSKFPEQEMYKPLRRAQMARWAHKSVAEGVAFFKKGQHEEAFQCLGKALHIDEENVEAYVAKGALLANLGRFEKAVEDFQKALKYNPTHSNARKYICETLVELGKQLEEDQKTEEAEKKYKQCLEINSTHKAAKDALSALERKLGRVPEPEEPRTVLRDLIDMEEEFKRKRNDSESSNKSSRARSLSPLSKKMAQQEGQWHPPPNINTTSSFLGTTSVSSMGGSLPGHEYTYPVANWQSSTVTPNMGMMGVMPPLNVPPPGYPHYPVQGSSSAVPCSNREDEEYKARVEKFLKDIEGSRPLEKKDRSKKRYRKDSESRSRQKHSRARKKKKTNKSNSSYSGSSSSSRSRSRSSSSSSSDTSSSDQSYSSHSSKSNSKSKSSSKKHKHKKSQKKKKEKKSNKVEKSSKREHKKSESSSLKTSEVSKVEEEAIPGLDSLEEKLSAYFKKVEASQREDSAKDSEIQNENEMKNYKQGICMSLKPQQISVSTSSFKKVHPAFRESDEDLEENASHFIDMARKCGKLEKLQLSLKIPKSNFEISEIIPANSKERSRSPGGKTCHSKAGSHKSFSRSRTRSRSNSRNREESPDRRSRGRTCTKSKSPPYHHERDDSHRKYRGKSARESQSLEKGKHNNQNSSGLGHLMLHDCEKKIEAAKSRLGAEIDYEVVENTFSKSKLKRWNADSSDSPPYSKFSRTKTPNRWDSSYSRTSGNWESSRPKTPSRWDSSRPKTPSRWDSSRPKTPSRWDSRPKTPSRWDSSRPKTPSRWDSSRPKTPSRWDSSRPKTPSRWDSSRPKTPSRWDSSRPKTPSRWDSSRPKTPSRWDSSRPKTPSRWDSSRPKTPSRWDSSRPKTPSRWDSSRPKTPSRWSSSRPKTPSKWDSHRTSRWYSSQSRSPSKHEPMSPERWESSLHHKSSRSPSSVQKSSPEIKNESRSPDRSARFGKWDEENGKPDDPKIGNTLKEMESFVETAKQKKLEAMKERNKEFLKPSVD